MMVDNNNCVLEPEGFLEVIQSLTDRFEQGEQNDAQEFLVYLLDMIHEDLNRVTSVLADREQKQAVETANLTTLTLEESAKKAWRNYLVDNKSVVVDIFQGQIRSAIKCEGCSTTSTTFDPVMYFSLPFPETEAKDAKLTVTDLLKIYT